MMTSSADQTDAPRGTGCIERHDSRIDEILDVDTCVEQLATGLTWVEGPLWLPSEDALLCSDIPANRIMRWSAEDGLTEYASNVEFANGRTLDGQGRVVQCSHGRRGIERAECDGTVQFLVGEYRGAQLNSPNDIIAANDGSLWFTDPPYGIVQAHEGHLGERQYGDNWVFRFDPETQAIRPVVTDVDEPNGLAFSPDESLLYVADSSAALRDTGRRQIRVYEVMDAATVVGGKAQDGPIVKNGRFFAEMDRGLADGIRVDALGNVWTTNGPSVCVYAPDGVRLATIEIPEIVGNLCFGGPRGDELFLAASTSLYRIQTKTYGAELRWLGATKENQR